MRAIVLAGGGSKGAYQIGVWRALRKLNISYDIVTGTSVGALNSAFMVQNDYFKALLLWYNLKSSTVYDSSMKIESNKDFIKYAKKIFKDGGIKIDNLEKTVDKYINIEKIYKSKIDMGIVTVKFPSLEPLELKKSDIPKDKLKDYLLASASCFPAFPVKEIDGEEYIDGGFYDNLPINLAISMGATEIIAVDLDFIGVKQKIKDNSIPIRVISPSSKTGSFLIFDKISSRRAIRLGYNDTMKSFGKLEGNLFAFKKGSLKYNYLKYKDKFINKFHNFLNLEDKGLLSKIAHISVYAKVFNYDDPSFYQKFNDIVEKTGSIFDLDDSYLYSMNKYNKFLHLNLRKLSKHSFDDIYSNRNSSKIKRLFNDDLMVAYLYNYLNSGKDVSDISNIILIFPNAFLSALYLIITK